MTTPEEEARKKSAEAKAQEPEKPIASSNDGLSVMGQLFGDAKNLAVDAVSGIHSGDKVLSSITPQLAAQYQHGKELQERIASGAVKESQLSASDKKNLEAFNSVRKSISQVPLYDRDSLTRYVEKGIQQKAKTAPIEVSHPTVAKDGAIHKTPAKQAEHPLSREAGDHKKSAAHPPQSARRDVPGATTTGVTADTKTASQKPSQAMRPQDRTEMPQLDGINVRPRERSDARQQDTTDTRPLESRTSVPRPQSSHPAGIDQRDVKPEGQRNVLVSGHNEVKSDLGAQRPGAIAQSRPAESGSPQRVGETVATRQFAYDATAQGFKVSRTESYVNKTFREGSSAISTFERRTGYDARVQQEAKLNLYGRNVETQNQAQSIERADVREQKVRATPESAPQPATGRDAVIAGSTHIQRSFENMRRVLDERTSIANVQTQKSGTSEQMQKPGTAEQSQIKSTENLETHRFQRHPSGAEQRVSLSEIRSKLPDHQVQQIVRISEELFPAGLRWQNTIRHPDSAPPAGKGRAPEISGAIAPVKSVDRGAGSASTRPGIPGEISQSKVGQSASSTAKVLTFNGRVNDRYITGAEIALAAIIAAAGAKRIRFDETMPGSDIGTPIPRVQKIQAFLPHKSVSEKGTPRTEAPKFDQRRPDVPLAENTSAFSPRQNALRQETFTSTFKPTEKRFFTGVEVALAAIVASCGTARIRQNLSQPPAEERISAVNKEESDKQDFPDDNVPGTLLYLQTHKFNRRTILIGSNDTFVSIAERELAYKDGNLGWLIVDINLNRIKETYVDGKRIVEVRSRQTIEIPSADEIILFMRHRKDEHKAENLITIVVEAQVDRELLNEHLGVFVDREEKTSGLLPKYENL